ncbi:MAG: helix-turn-helix domain-containing protein [Candidatus Limnocylindrales bacterium]
MPESSTTTTSPLAPTPTDALASINGSSTLRRDLLVRLRSLGPSSPEALAADLGVSRTGMLQQLHSLEQAGLVSRQAVKHGVGRPRHLYDVTEAAQDLFPTNYDGLANGLLAAIRSIGGDELITGVFDERRRLTRDRVRQRLAERLPPDAPLIDRVRELAVIQDEQGYLAEAQVGPDGVVRLDRAQLRDLPGLRRPRRCLPRRARPVPRDPRRRCPARDAYRGGRPVLHVSTRERDRLTRRDRGPRAMIDARAQGERGRFTPPRARRPRDGRA